MRTFQQYPKAMKHPQHRPATKSQDYQDPVTKRWVDAPPGQPERFPSVFVHNEDQEKQYAALGYVPNGVSDPEAYHAAMTGNEEPNSHQHREYPRYMYKAHPAGEHTVHVDHEPVRVRGVVVKDELERDKLGDGWFESPRDAAEATLTDDSEAQGEEGSDDPEQPEGAAQDEQQEPARNRGGRTRKNPEAA